MPEALSVPHTLDLALRPWRANDLPDLVAAANYPQLGKLLPQPYTEQAGQAWLAEAGGAVRDHFWAIAVNDKAVGGLGFRALQWRHDGVGVVGYWLTPPLWKQNIVPACLDTACRWAFAHTSLRRLEAGVYSSNPASQRVLEKAGFIREAELKGRISAGGTVLDEIIFARLRPEPYPAAPTCSR